MKIMQELQISGFDGKGAQAFTNRQAVYFNIVDPGMARAVPEPVKHQFNMHFGTLNHRFDLVIGRVADIAFQA